MEMAATPTASTGPYADNSQAGTEAMSSSVPDALPARSKVSVASRTRGGKHTIELPLAECLQPWFDVFESCTARWGLITDAREDGATYSRHGIIVQLTADITAVVEASDDTTPANLRRIRRGVDLVNLALAVDPHVLMPLLRRQKSAIPDLSKSPKLTLDDLEQLTRGDAPFELRLRLEIESKEAKDIQDSLVEQLMRKPDEAHVEAWPGSPSALRRYLVESAFATSAAHRLLHCPVKTVIKALPSCANGIDVVMMNTDDCNEFFKSWASATDALHVYQDWRDYKWDLAKNLTPLVVEKIQLDLCTVPLTTGVVQAITVMANKGIPVSSSYVRLDPQYASCEEPELQAFLRLIVRGVEAPLTVSTGPMTYKDIEPADPNDEDFYDKILMLMRCIGGVNHDIKLLIGTFFMACRARRNREAFFCGLFESVFSREQATSVYFSHTDATVEDTELFEDAADAWRDAFPDKKVRLRALDWLPKDQGMGFYRAFIEDIDDVESIGIFPAGEPFLASDVRGILRFPSLHTVYIELADLPSMDIFATGTGSQRVPALQSLELSGVRLGDPSSLTRFIEKLDPHGVGPSTLSTSLRILGISEARAVHPPDLGTHHRTLRLLGQIFHMPPRTTIHPAEDSDQSFIRRAVNDAATVATLEEVLASNTVLQHVSFLGNFANVGPVHLEWTSPEKPPTRSRIPAPIETQQSAVVKAQNAAFLSAIQDGNCVPLRLLDSNVTKLIFAFSAPHAFREIHI